MDFLANIANTLAFAMPDISTQVDALIGDLESVMTSILPSVVAILGIRKVGSFALGLLRGA